MIIKITNQEGATAFIENEEQVNGAVKVAGDSSLAAHLNHILNLDVDIPFTAIRNLVDEKFTTTVNGMLVFYKASDVYLKEYFIPVECNALGYTAEVLKE